MNCLHESVLMAGPKLVWLWSYHRFYKVELPNDFSKIFFVHLSGKATGRNTISTETKITSATRTSTVHQESGGPHMATPVLSNPGLATNSIFFCFLFVKNQWPLVGEILFSHVPAIKLPLVSYHWRAFWADTLPFFHHWLASCIASGTKEKQGHR